MDFVHFQICSPQMLFCCKDSQISFIFDTSQQIFASKNENILPFFSGRDLEESSKHPYI